jgi:CCR4-NOT transcription complex subunit 7/8
MSFINIPAENIKEVYNENMVDELRKISDLIEEFNYISMDTEFPGIVYPNTHQLSENVYCNFSNSSIFSGINSIQRTIPSNSGKFSSKKVFQNKSNETSSNSYPTYTYDLNYKNIKMNVDDLKMIQFGITLSDKYGNHPEGISTWQFNFKFDLDTDIYLHESIKLLEFAGIDFNKLFHEGIEQEYFAENIIASVVVLNENVKWITFHGAYDFAYLLKTISNQSLPEDEQTFLEYLFIYFPNSYDLRYMIKSIAWLKGSLSRIATDLDIKLNGSVHQAGFDSILTSKVFTKLCLNYGEYLTLEKDLNMLYGFNAYTYLQEVDTEIINNSNLNTHINSTNPISSNSTSQADITTGQGLSYPTNVATSYFNNYNKFQMNTQIKPNNAIVYSPYLNVNYNPLNTTNHSIVYPNINSSYSQVPSFNNYVNYDCNNYYGGNMGSLNTNAIRK